MTDMGAPPDMVDTMANAAQEGLIQLSKVVWNLWKHLMQQAKVLMLHLVMDRLRVIWDQDHMGPDGPPPGDMGPGPDGPMGPPPGEGGPPPGDMGPGPRTNGTASRS